MAIGVSEVSPFESTPTPGSYSLCDKATLIRDGSTVSVQCSACTCGSYLIVQRISAGSLAFCKLSVQGTRNIIMAICSRGQLVGLGI